MSMESKVISQNSQKTFYLTSNEPELLKKKSLQPNWATDDFDILRFLPAVEQKIDILSFWWHQNNGNEVIKIDGPHSSTVRTNEFDLI